MAKTLYEGPFVGRRVYNVYSPSRAGVVIEDLGPNSISRPDHTVYVSSRHSIRVKWLNGTETITTTGHVNDFDALVEDHQRKLTTHLKTLAKLEALVK